MNNKLSCPNCNCTKFYEKEELITYLEFQKDNDKIKENKLKNKIIIIKDYFCNKCKQKLTINKLIKYDKSKKIN